MDEFKEEKSKRDLVRKEMHRKLFRDFMKLLENHYPEAIFTEDFLVREYTRVGFNKLMTRIKFSHMATFLCNDDDSEYFQFSVIMPPFAKH